MTDYSVWHPVLQCRVQVISYTYSTRCAQIWMPADSCTDMSGAIKLATSLDPEVRSIKTYADGCDDTAYALRDGAWVATTPQSVQS